MVAFAVVGATVSAFAAVVVAATGFVEHAEGVPASVKNVQSTKARDISLSNSLVKCG